jgi:hypothetical protein
VAFLEGEAQIEGQCKYLTVFNDINVNECS